MHVDDDIRLAEGLPATAFTERAFLARELATIFRASWLVVPERGDDPRPLDEQVAARGSRVPITVARSPAVRAARLGRRRAARVPEHVHARLVSARARREPRPDARVRPARPALRLHAAVRLAARLPATCPTSRARAITCSRSPVATWRRLTFVNFDAGAHAARRGVRADRRVARAACRRCPSACRAEIRDVAGNWKQHAWNFLDQLPHRLRPSRARRARRRDRSRLVHDRAPRATRSCSGSTRATPPTASIRRGCPSGSHDPKGRRVFALWWFVFPNLALNFYPWGLSVNVYQPMPERPDATRFVWYQFALDRDEARRARSPLAVVAGRRRRRRRARAGQPRPALRASRRAAGSRPTTSRPRTGSIARSRPEWAE